MGKGQKKGRSKNFKPLDQAQLVQSTSQPQPGGSGASARTDQRQAASVRVDNIPQSSSGKGPSVDVKTQDPTISQKNKSVDQRNVWANQSQQSNKPGPSSEQTIRKTAETPISGNPKGRNQSDSFANPSKKPAWSRNANWKTDERHTSGNTRDKTEVERRQSYDTRTEKGSGYQEHKKSYVDKQITSVANKLADTSISGSSSKSHYDQSNRKPQNSSASNPSGSTNQIVSSGEKTERSPEKHIDMRIVPSKPGTKGRAIRVETNYVSINLGKHKSIIHYDVKITPEVRIKRMIREIMSIFRENYYNDRYPAFDNMSNLYSVTLLGGQENLSGEVEFEGKTYKIDLQFAKTVDLTPLQNIFSAEMTPQDALQVVNIVLRSGPSSRLLSAGRSFFFKNQPCVDLKDGMQLYSGFYQSAVRGSKLLLNIDVSHKAVPKDKTLLEIVDEFFRNKDTLLQHWQIQKLGDFLKGLKVTYQIPGNSSSKRSYKVNGVRESAASRETFSLEGGKQITVQQYYATEKNYRLKYPDLPAIHVGDPKRSIFVPLELCKIEKEQMVRKNLTDNNKREMIANTATSTYDRKKKIQGCISKVNYNNDPTVNEFGITVGDQFLQLTARVLDPPDVFYSDRKVVTPNRGQWNRSGDFKKADVKSWIVVSCVEERYFHQNDLQKLADQIKYYSQLPRSQFVNIIGNRERNIMSFFENKKNQQFDVVFVVVSDRAEDRSYSYVKQAAELHTNCITQCLKQKTAKNIISDDRRGSQTIANIMLKVNAKLNGINHVLKDLPDILKNCMVMGADVTHPGPHSNIPSVAAVTASHDDRASQYNICWRLQKGEGRQELIQDMRTIVREHLTFYKTERGCLPMKIVFYRDGVSEGEFQQVLNSEVRDIRAACHDLDAKYKPLLTFLVVLKRHHTRLFPTNKEDIYDTRYFNVPAGTCVDTEITNPSMQDFYLVSHTSIKGVAKPTRYCTLLDENNLSNDDIEQLSYYLCHLYSRCTRSVSYPAPTYYAHLVAARGKVYISTIKNLDMENLEVVCKRMIIANKIRHTHPMFFV